MHSLVRLFLVFAALVIPSPALVSGPYVADANTVHLFHLSEASGTSISANAVAAGPSLIAFNGSSAANSPNAQPVVTTLLGAAGASGFGNAAAISNVAHGLGLDANFIDGFQPGNSTTAASVDSIQHSALTGVDGSFTLEALINIPSITVKREVISTDSSMNSRCFQFYTDTDGTLKFNFIGGPGATASAVIPTTGPQAFVANEWFHVAYVFNGTTAVSTFYWTRLVGTNTQANALATSGVETMVTSNYGPLVIGNEGRGASGEGLLGLIDEVRISKIARAASGFLFAPNDSDGDGLDDGWEIANFANITAQNGAGDPDGDSYNNEAEETAGTDPNRAASNPGDLDADGLHDAWELGNFGSITAQNGSGDPDGDFATNLQEFAAGTNPNGPLSWPDTDSDSVNDGWEVFYFGNLNHSGSADSDNDGSTDREEFTANSNPVNPLWSATRATLAHRWSFNGTLSDSSGGVTAMIVDPDANSAAGGTGVLSSTDVLLGGGARTSSAYIQLGAGGLLAGKKTPVTIELWATQVGVQNWGRIFDFGSGTTEYLMMSWTRGTTAAQDQVKWLDTATASADDKVTPYSAATPYHIVMTLEPRVGASGSTRVTWYVAPAGSSTLGAPKWTYDTTNTLLALNDSLDYLGRSQFTGDSTANARYDECRIWDGALTTTERETFHAAGPNVATVEDSDHDGLPDAWEMKNFNDLDETASGDPDGDGYTNATEFTSLSDPNLAASTPLDLDADGLTDAWETKYFGSVSATPTADPDGDGEANLTEQANGSAPNNRASTSADIDADGLPDAWELAHFPDRTTNAGSDPDGDGFGNLQEYQAATDPMDAASRPSGTAVKLVPLDDGDHATSDFGYAGSSAINSVAFVRSSIKTVGNQQFITWYGRHQYDSAAAYNNTIWIGRRTLGSSQWQIFRHPSFTANTITDGHDVICYGIDGEGYMHLSWGMHGDAFHYAKSTAPVTGSGPIALGADTTMTSYENAVTYPQFLTLPDGDLLYLFREGASGSGDTYLNRYDIATHTWAPVHHSGTQPQLPFIKGTGWSPDYNAYVNMPQLGRGNGNELTLTWCWRYSSGTSDTGSGAVGYQTNSNVYFARSLDAGVTWQHADGTPYALPISSVAESGVEATRAERIVNIPENSSLINQASSCLDQSGNPVVASWWAPLTSSGNYRRQYMVVFRDGGGVWQTRTVSDRVIDPATTRYPEASVRNMGRPIVVNDDSDRLIVAYRDNRDANGITLVHSLPRASDPNRVVWIQFDLTTENLGNYEPIIDNELWDRERQLHFLYQAAEGQGYTAPANLASRFSVLEWDAAHYFAHTPQPSVAFSADHSQISITCPSQPSWAYRLWSSTNLQNWQALETRAGTGQPLVFTQAANSGESRRFWRVEFKEGGFN